MVCGRATSIFSNYNFFIFPIQPLSGRWTVETGYSNVALLHHKEDYLVIHNFVLTSLDNTTTLRYGECNKRWLAQKRNMNTKPSHNIGSFIFSTQLRHIFWINLWWGNRSAQISEAIALQVTCRYILQITWKQQKSNPTNISHIVMTLCSKSASNIDRYFPAFCYPNKIYHPLSYLRAGWLKLSILYADHTVTGLKTLSDCLVLS